jgi:cadmium resistance protein CadD (predicted permease)
MLDGWGQCQSVAQTFEEYAKYLVPLFLIVLGVYILSESVLWPIIWPF